MSGLEDKGLFLIAKLCNNDCAYFLKLTIPAAT